MWKQLAVVLAVGLLAGAGGQKDAGQDELKKFEGTWRFKSAEAEGNPVPADQLKDQWVTFQGDRFTLKQGNQEIRAGTLRLDPSKIPKAIDATVTEGQNKGSTVQGIYELQGDTARLCIAIPGNARPTEFKGGPGLFLATIQRE
jgi:uncharacterized protein (TIGR03067 family)